MSNVLDRIVAEKWREIERHQSQQPLAAQQQLAATAPPVRNFLQALLAHHPMGVIAEVKRASPSAGLIRSDFDPVEIAKTYAAHGAACISVLTDEPFFQGHLDYLRQVRGSVSIPVLRKDFIVDPYQVWQARAAGADAVLLIAECLEDKTLSDLYALISRLGMTPLVELYEPENLPRVLALNPPLIGINNRNLKNFETRLTHTLDLRKCIPESILVVGESGIHTREHVLLLQGGGAHAILVGESLMRSNDIGTALDRLLGR